MKNNDIISIDDVENLFRELFEKATREQVKSNLKRINEVCKKMVEVNATPSVPAVVKVLASKGLIVSERSIYNRREGKNPYPILIDAWIKVAQGRQLGLKTLVKASTEAHAETAIIVDNPNAFITEEDLLNISDPVLRYKISVLYGQMVSLTKQNAALRQLRELPAVYPDYNAQPSGQKIEDQSNASDSSSQINSLDVEILTNLLDGQSGHLYFDDEGTLFAARAIRTHTAISDPGLKEVIEKIIPKRLDR
ncbi:hypothetical protein [Vibrio sp. WXL103]|uniref:hypothetical protein n=1 Tax=Vibrio sp. WXL103 TaxID=3450710 RepID=UPI003EC4D3C1